MGNAFVQRSRTLSGNFMVEECYLGCPENTSMEGSHTGIALLIIYEYVGIFSYL
jgi:hypothetical protein